MCYTPSSYLVVQVITSIIHNNPDQKKSNLTINPASSTSIPHFPPHHPFTPQPHPQPWATPLPVHTPDHIHHHLDGETLVVLTALSNDELIIHTMIITSLT
jgi:hypothetical protein